MPDPSHLLIARVHGVAARSAELRAAAEELASASARQDGCLGFDVLTVSADPSELVLLSAWRSDRELRAHFSSARTAATSRRSPICSPARATSRSTTSRAACTRSQTF